MKVFYLGSNEESKQKGLKQGLLRGSGKWIIWKQSNEDFKMLKENLMI